LNLFISHALTSQSFEITFITSLWAMYSPSKYPMTNIATAAIMTSDLFTLLSLIERSLEPL